METKKLKLRSSYKQFSGYTNYYSHNSEVCGGTMNFAVYLPPQASQEPVPVLYWLSGLTCTEENFVTKAYAQIHAAKYGVCLVAPDTSPRDTGIVGENDSYDLGSGAGFYVDAEQAPWSKQYNMYSYIVKELRDLVEKTFPVDANRTGIFGHSMGGHGALVLGLRNPRIFKSISAFAPICAPTKCAWGIKAFQNYLGDDRSKWNSYDANELLREIDFEPNILIDQGLADEFLPDQLNFELFAETCRQKQISAELRKHEDYDHSYFFISTFIEDHIKFHCSKF